MEVGSPPQAVYSPGAPIMVVPFSSKWAAAFAREATAIQDAVGDVLLAVHHIGSTAVPGLLSKPVIDILPVVISLRDLDRRSAALEQLGYEACGEYGIPGRRYFRKTTSNGIRTHHVHAFAAGSAEIDRHLNFRDYLRVHPADAAAYAELKARLARDCGADIGAYGDGKTAFIQSIERRATAWRQTQGSSEP